ncbi:MAG: sugar phosphate isomerase/epimerase [Planctomycetota bacterium]|nr:sugar phosphate isomerase/epimerase [Planctomycetota bacterium]
MRFSYVLPDPGSYRRWDDFESDLACLKRAGYDAVELQIADPAQLDEARLRRSLDAAGCLMCAFQTGGTYATRGNCLSTADETIRARTVELLKRFVDLAARWQAVMVFGSLQGRLKDEPDAKAGERRIAEALAEIGRQATQEGVTIAVEPVNHSEVGFHNTIAAVSQLVRGLDLPGVRMMVDTYHMNIEERDMLAPLAGIADILAHVHLCETNRGVLGAGHWNTAAFLAELRRLGFGGFCSIGVYNTALGAGECMTRCMAALRSAHLTGENRFRMKRSF